MSQLAIQGVGIDDVEAETVRRVFTWYTGDDAVTTSYDDNYRLIPRDRGAKIPRYR